jgi:hypothetical protein
VTKVEMTFFYKNGGWESDGLERVAGSGDACNTPCYGSPNYSH